jgi:hypothetical protein
MGYTPQGVNMRITSLTDHLLEKVCKLAEQNHDGHVTLMKFTTGWKVMFGTPHFSPGEIEYLSRCFPGEQTLSEALRTAILHPKHQLSVAEEEEWNRKFWERVKTT